MRSKEEITATLKAQFANARVRGKIMAQALKARADIAATRRRLRATFAELGEEAYDRIASGQIDSDAGLADFTTRIEGLQVELRQREEALEQIVSAPAPSTPAEDGEDAH